MKPSSEDEKRNVPHGLTEHCKVQKYNTIFRKIIRFLVFGRISLENITVSYIIYSDESANSQHD